jgi:hypothetical protein
MEDLFDLGRPEQRSGDPRTDALEELGKKTVLKVGRILG